MHNHNGHHSPVSVISSSLFAHIQSVTTVDSILHNMVRNTPFSIVHSLPFVCLCSSLCPLRSGPTHSCASTSDSPLATPLKSLVAILLPASRHRPALSLSHRRMCLHETIVRLTSHRTPFVPTLQMYTVFVYALQNPMSATKWPRSLPCTHQGPIIENKS